MVDHRDGMQNITISKVIHLKTETNLMLRQTYTNINCNLILNATLFFLACCRNKH